MTAKNLDAKEIREGLDRLSLDLLNQWLENGRGVAVYENQDLGHPAQGHRQYVSFGVKNAQVGEVPPQTLPDWGDSINWRYQLVGVYQGAQL